MNKYLLTTILMSLSLPSLSNCHSNAISMSRTTSYGFTLKSGRKSSKLSNSRSINIPVEYGDTRGCIRQDSSLAISVEIKKKKNKSEIQVFAPKVQSKNLFDVAVNTYVHFNQVEGSTESFNQDVRLSLLTYTCVGSKLILGKTFEGSLKQAEQLENLQSSYQSTFATGIAARRIEQRRKEHEKRLGSSTIIPNFFVHHIENLNESEIRDNDENEVKIPTVLMSSVQSSPLISYRSHFASNMLMDYGCSREFQKKLAPYNIKNIKKQLESLPVKVKIKDNGHSFRLRW